MSLENECEDNKADIAIIGLSIRLPGIDTVSQFWEAILGGEEVVANTSSQDKAEVASAEGRQNFIRTNTNIRNIENFDAAFFNFNIREASLMDPQHRLLLEMAWEALEAAGYDPGTYEGLIGMYAGVYANYYQMFNLMPLLNGNRAASELQMQIASEKDHAATMAAYKLGLTGPVLNVQSACSSSLVAVHLACESLLTYSSDMMVCGGATLGIPQANGYYYQDNGLLSADGHLRAFDKQATGTLYSDGAGCVVLKRYSDALEDGDTIHAVIKGSAVNNDGALKAGYAAPAVKGQIQVIERAQMNAGVSAADICYIEAHGTGTPLGDAIELEALHEVFARHTEKNAFCALGSVKSNVGHTGPSAGIVGLIKTVMALRERILPPAIHADTPHDRLMTGQSPFYLNPVPLEWSSPNQRRLAGVSSFGLGGTNAHVILQEAPVLPKEPSLRRSKLFVLSAKSSEALKRQKQSLQQFLSSASEELLADAAYTLQTGRKLFEHRAIWLYGCGGETEWMERETGKKDNPDLAGMPLFHFPDLSNFEAPELGGWIAEEMVFYNNFVQGKKLAEEWSGKGDSALQEQATYALTVQISLFKLWESWGIHPSGCQGTGSGLFAAAYACGLLTYADALYLGCSFTAALATSGEAQGTFVRSYRQRVSSLKTGPMKVPLAAPPGRGPMTHTEWSNSDFWTAYLTDALEDGTSLQTSSKNEKDRLVLDMNLGEPSESHGTTEWKSVYLLLGKVWMEGCPVNWKAYYQGERRRRIELPAYPFERTRCWVDRDDSALDTTGPLQPISEPVNLRPEQLDGYIAPRTEVERDLVAAWELYLGVSPIGINDNYYELGGNSLLAASLHAHICEQFCVTLRLEVFLEQQTIARLAESIESWRLNSISVKGGH
ncbi:beta-ketoacyl synthase N-terminal-like domain-containing protein [Paenibacillus sp. FSL L8-0470]|uniref:type I polyketide synthase n=1 Tax=Paenibacillus sp. FSL L8-0470 TaxID=2954688 RepID=UPI0030F9F456